MNRTSHAARIVAHPLFSAADEKTQRVRGKRTMTRSLLLAAALLASGAANASDDTDRARAEMQKKLNNQVMSAPFDPGDINKAEEYAAGAKAANVVPVAQPPTYWAPGWTCANLTSYAYYNYGDYRNCIYYHHYYGRYWYRR